MSSVVMNYENLKGLISSDAPQGNNQASGQNGGRTMPFNRRQPNIGFVADGQDPNNETRNRVNGSLYEFIRENDP